MKAMKHRQPSPRPGKPRPKQAKQKGVTLFELLLVLFVAAFVAVAVATIYTRVNNTFKENNLFNDVQQMAANIQSLYSSQGDYDGLTSTVVTQAGVAPDNFMSGSKKVHQFARNSENAWDVREVQGNAEEFEIEINDLPSSTVCSGLASKGLSTANLVKVGSNDANTVANIAQYCAGAGPHSVTFVYD
jgi:type II secretory pathway pseudopilin PulG